MKFIYRCFVGALSLFGVLPHATNAQSRNYNFNSDSLSHQLTLQKTVKDSARVLQQMVDASFSADVLFDSDALLAAFLQLNNKAKLTDPRPYQLLLDASELYKNKGARQALESIEQAIYLFDKQRKVIVPLLMHTRLFFNVLKDQEARLSFFSKRLEYYQVNGPVENTAPCYHAIAGYYKYQNAYNQAINNYLKAGSIYQKFDEANYANDVGVVGDMYGDWGNKEKAIYYLNIATALQARLKDSTNLAYCEFAISKILFKDKKLTEAINKLSHAEQFSPHNLPDQLCDILVTKSECLIEAGQPALALPILIRAKAIVDSASLPIINTSGDLEIDYGFYLYYKSIKKNTEAEKSLLMAYKNARAEEAVGLKIKYAKELGNLYLSTNKPELAKTYFDLYFNFIEGRDRAQDKFKVAQFEIDQNDLQQKEHINQLKQEQVLQDYQIGRRNALLWLSLAVVLIVSVLLVFIYRQLRVNKKTLISLRETQKQLIQSEKMASLGELTAGIAHEIQNPLNFVNNFSEVNAELIDELQEEMDKADYEEAKAIANDIKENQIKIGHHGKRADFIVKGMLQHSRTSTAERQPTDINVLADEFLKLSYHGLRAKDKSFNAELTTNYDMTLPKISVIQQDIGRVLLNLFNNAFYAVNQKKKITDANYRPEVTVTTLTKNGLVFISVKDNGNGIPDAIKDKIMQPFFTTKPTGEGTGLGLSLSYDIVVKGHAGNIQVNSQEGQFTEIVVSLPLS